MSKGILEMNNGNNNNNGGEKKETALRFLKEGESLIVGIPSIKEFYLKQIVSVYDSVINTPVILPTVVEKIEKTLYDKVVKELWNDYNEVKGDEVTRKKVLNKINALKRQDYVYFGMKDINTGEDIILSMGINLEEGRRNKAGNNFYQAITKMEKHLKKFPLEITKGSMGAWTILPYMEDLTDKQEVNLKATTEIREEVYTSVFFKSSEEKQASDVRKFGKKFGFNVERVGISADEPSREEINTCEENYCF
ncbi:hypothetical protein SAMN02745163_02388 [Clostridium cavendishii DSM 21758]|uniref:Uncharacterized protein n=1 Tax=Clostridium cavendishii DSM 21758 TaxID=1121302 RepID=A0A1M6LI00_9CLOT|nr:hypothetical protein [Clostridium cavendishii]SHJ70822.1 hypothetical protein SAMN02745163_02388 [Clostridium cavendishii DSM 21758]